MSFEKPGRPRNDPAEERLRIYAAALPAIRHDGPRARMDTLAELAHISVGGIYHYFDSKRSLILHGLNPEALSLACATFHRDMEEAAEKSADAVVSAYVERTMYLFRLIQPAVTAAMELGISEMRSQLSEVLRQDADGLVAVLATVATDLDRDSLLELAVAIRRTLMALSLDPNSTEAEIRTQLTALLRGYVDVIQPIPG